MSHGTSDPALAAVAFAGACVLSLAGTPLARRTALRLGILDHPGSTKIHGQPTPYLGGVAILGGAGAVMASTGTWQELGAILTGAAVLALVGLRDDVTGLSAPFRLGVQGVVALVVVASGVRAAPTGILAVDLAVSVLWIVGITNAFNLLDNMNGLSSGVAFVGVLTFFGLASLGGQRLVGAMAAAVAGGIGGFLPYNFPKARIFMGDGGALPLGFLLAVIGIKLRFPISQPWSFFVPVCALGVAVLDTSVVVADRIRHGRRLMRGGTDHLSHRLVARGLSPIAAVLVLWGAAALFGGAALAVGRGLVPAPWLLVVGALAGGAGLWFLAPAPGGLGETAARPSPPAAHQERRAAAISS